MSVSEKAISWHPHIRNKIFSIVTTVESSNEISLKYKPNVLY